MPTSDSVGRLPERAWRMLASDALTCASAAARSGRDCLASSIRVCTSFSRSCTGPVRLGGSKRIEDFGFSPITLASAPGLQWDELIALPVGTRLCFTAPDAHTPPAEVELTGLRNPCVQIDDFQPGLFAALLDRTAQGDLVRKAGVMAVVHTGGQVTPGSRVTVVLPPEPHRPMERI